MLKRLYHEDKRIGLIRVNNNVGQHQATLLGLLNSHALYSITIDADLQTPLSEIVKLTDKLQSGYHVVIAKYQEKTHNFIQNAGSKMIDVMLSMFFGKPNNLRITSFKLFDQFSVDKLRPYLGVEGFLSGFILQVIPTDKITNSDYCEHYSSSGNSLYSWFSLQRACQCAPHLPWTVRPTCRTSYASKTVGTVLGTLGNGTKSIPRNSSRLSTRFGGCA